MAIVTSQQIHQYYEKYGKIDVTFTKEINDSLNLVRNQIYLKYKGGRRPCIIYSSSMLGAKVVVALTDDLIQTLRRDNLVSLRFCFKKADKDDVFSFFIQSRIAGLTQYDKERHLHFAQLKFSQRPPDDLIEILGSLLEASINAARRTEERITITEESLRRMGLASKSAIIVVDGIPRNGILRDISFGGAKVILMGNPKYLIDKPTNIRLVLSNGKTILLKGRILRFDPVEERKDLAAVAIQYEEGSVPFEYKMFVNDYLKYTGRLVPKRDSE